MSSNNQTSRQLWPSDLRNYADRLGPPDAVFSTVMGGIRVETVLGGLMLVIGTVSHALYWFVLNQPDLPNRVLLLFLGCIPGIGVLLLFSLWRSRDLWVLIYPTGILHWSRGVVKSFPWEEIRSLVFSGVKTFGDLIIQRGQHGQVLSAWLPVQETTYFSWGLRILRDDGATAIVSEHIANSSELSRIIQERTFEIFWPVILQRLRSGNDCPFGFLRASQSGLTDDKDDLVFWDQIGSVRTEISLQIRKVGQRYPWRTMRIWNLPNPHVLLALVATQKEWIAPVG